MKAHGNSVGLINVFLLKTTATSKVGVVGSDFYGRKRTFFAKFVIDATRYVTVDTVFVHNFSPNKSIYYNKLNIH